MHARDFTVGWVCALPHELAASKAMLDATLDPPPPQENDDNVYTTGRIGRHNIVMVCLPVGKYSTEPAAVVVKDMLRSFPSIKFNVLVGIGGGVPSATSEMRLVDVVVSKPAKTHGGVVQYDLGKTLPGDTFEQRGHLNKPPSVLLNAVNKLQAEHEHGQCLSNNY